MREEKKKRGEEVEKKGELGYRKATIFSPFFSIHAASLPNDSLSFFPEIKRLGQVIHYHTVPRQRAWVASCPEGGRKGEPSTSSNRFRRAFI